MSIRKQTKKCMDLINKKYINWKAHKYYKQQTTQWIQLQIRYRDKNNNNFLFTTY